MIEFLSSWVKGLGLAIIIVSILEMLLPNNKTKKYIRMVMGVYVLLTMISPFLSKQEIGDIEDMLSLENYSSMQTSSYLDQSSMDERIKELYQEELEKDIIKKLKEKGYQVNSCKVRVQISDNEEETKINKIQLQVEKQKEQEIQDKDENLENQIVTQIQRIKPIDTSISKQEDQESSQEKKQQETSTKVKQSDIQNIKKFLIEEYEVNEKCLQIN